MTLLLSCRDREYWVQFDRTARVYEMFASPHGDDYLGCFDTKAEAKAYAKQHAEEG